LLQFQKQVPHGWSFQLLNFGLASFLMDCRMKPRTKLVTAMTALLLLAIPLAAVAAPNYRER
jgi:hypothetical protein